MVSTHIYVIIPAYNSEKYLNFAVESVINQPYKNITVVIIDDGSTDNTPAICDELSQNERVMVIHQKNAGEGAARNAGLRYVYDNLKKGDYIAFLDSDDIWKADTVTQELIDNIANNDIINFITVMANESLTRFAPYEKRTEKKQLYFSEHCTEWLLQGSFAANLYSGEILKNHAIFFPENVRHNTDIMFFKKIAFFIKSFLYVENPLYIYRNNSQSVTHKTNTDNFLKMCQDWYDLKYWIDSFDEVTEDDRQRWYNMCEAMAGVRLLETARLMATSGCKEQEIKEKIIDGNLYQFIEKLKESDLADWQKPDLNFIKSDFSGFVKHYRKKHFIKSVLKSAAGIPILRKVYDNRKYSLTQIN